MRNVSRWVRPKVARKFIGDGPKRSRANYLDKLKVNFVSASARVLIFLVLILHEFFHTDNCASVLSYRLRPTTQKRPVQQQLKEWNFCRKKNNKKTWAWLQQQWNVWASKKPRTSCVNTVIPTRESWRSCQQINLWTSGVIMMWTVSTESLFSRIVNKTRLIMMIIDSKIPSSHHVISESAMRQKKNIIWCVIQHTNNLFNKLRLLTF